MYCISDYSAYIKSEQIKVRTDTAVDCSDCVICGSNISDAEFINRIMRLNADFSASASEKSNISAMERRGRRRGVSNGDTMGMNIYKFTDDSPPANQIQNNALSDNHNPLRDILQKYARHRR